MYFASHGVGKYNCWRLTFYCGSSGLLDQPRFQSVPVGLPRKCSAESSEKYHNFLLSVRCMSRSWAGHGDFRLSALLWWCSAWRLEQDLPISVEAVYSPMRRAGDPISVVVHSVDYGPGGGVGHAGGWNCHRPKVDQLNRSNSIITVPVSRANQLAQYQTTLHLPLLAGLSLLGFATSADSDDSPGNVDRTQHALAVLLLMLIRDGFASTNDSSSLPLHRAKLAVSHKLYSIVLVLATTVYFAVGTEDADLVATVVLVALHSIGLFGSAVTTFLLRREVRTSYRGPPVAATGFVLSLVCNFMFYAHNDCMLLCTALAWCLIALHPRFAVSLSLSISL